MKRLLLLASALLCPAIGALAQTATLTASSSTYSASGGQVTFTATIVYPSGTNTLTAVNVTNGGSGYVTAPAVVFSGGGGGSGAAATATISGGAVVSVTITNAGSGYVTNPAVSFTGGGGSGATANSVANLPTALGYKIIIPSGWMNVSTGGPNTPNTFPDPDTTGTLDYVYSSFPVGQAQFTAVVAYPAGLTGDQVITASAIYRSPQTDLSVPSITITPTPTAPVISSGPANQTVTYPAGATFNVVASGYPAPSYQWQYQLVGIPGFIDLQNGSTFSGVKTDTLTVAGPIDTVNTGTLYRCVVTNSVASVTSASATLTVNKASQTITFGALAGKTFGDAPFTVNATASSGLAPSFSVVSGPATISGSTVTITGAGSVTVRAAQVGNLNYNAAANVDQSFTVAKADQTITFGALAGKTFGDAPFSVTASVSSGLAPSFSIVSGPATITGNTITITGVGTVTVRAAQSGNADYNAAASADQSFTVAKANQTIAFTLPASAALDQSPLALNGTATSGLAISYTSSDPTVAAISGTSLQLLKVGTTTITATQTGNGNYNAASDVVLNLQVTSQSQTVVFDQAQLPTKTFGNGTFTISATSNRGLLVGFTSNNTAVATVGASTLLSGVSSATVTIVGAGSANITASQAGDGNTASAPDVVRTLTVNKAGQTINFGALPAKAFGDADFSVTATATSGLAVSYASGNTAVATIDAATGVVHVVGVGSAAITASQAGDSNYNAAANVSQTLTVNKANQTIAFGAIPAKTFGDADFTVSGTASSGLGLSYASDNLAVATVNASSGLVHIVGGGTANITASQAGNGSYNAAPNVSQALTVNKANQTITFGALAGKTFGDAPFAVSATATSNLTPSFSIVSGPATVSGNTITITGAGNITVRASQAGNTNYNAAAPVDQSFAVAKADQTINFAALPSKPVDAGAFALTATASSGLAITYALSNETPADPLKTPVATLSGSTVTPANKGTVTITATQAGDSNYNPATSVAQVLTVLSQSQTITFAATELPTKTFGNAAFTINATSNRGLQISFASDNPAVATVGTSTLASNVSSATVTIIGAGTANITASQAGDSNTAAAPDVARTLTVNKAAAPITLGGLAQSYDGTPKPVTATTNPTGLNVVITYTPTGGTATTTAPTNAGSYAVSATVTGSTPPESNYAGTATGTLVIAKAAQTIAFTLASPVLINAAPIALSGAASPSSLPVTYVSSNTSVATVSGSTLTIKGLGTTTITASQAGDANYSAAADVARTFTVNPIAPVIVSTPPLAQTAIVGSNFVFGPISLASALAAPYTFSATGLPAGLTVNPANGNISGTPTAAPGSFTIVLTVTNATGTDSRTINLTLQPPAPVFTSAASVSGTAGSAFSYTAVASNATSYSISGSLPAGLLFNGSGVISGTATAAGTTTVNITATNATGSVTLPLVITMVAPADAPVYSGPLNPSGTAGVAFSFTPNFGAGTGTTTYALAGGAGILPTGLFFNSTNGAITGTPAQPGVTPVTLSATRAGVTASVLLTITINPAATAPVISFPAPGNVRSATVGSAMTSIQLTATPAATSFASVDPLPGGITLSAAGLIAGTPTTPGTTYIALKATNSAGTGPTAVLVLTVNPNPNAPVITSAALVNGRVGVPLTYTLTATPAGTTTWSMVGTLPSGLNFDTATGVVSGTPTAVPAANPVVFFTGTNANGAGNALDVTFNIAPPLTVPVITSAGTVSGQVGQPFSYAIAATNSPTSYALTLLGSLPAGLTLNSSTGVISGVPSLASSTVTAPIVGTFTVPTNVAVTATNAAGTSEPKTLAITISPAPGSPVITSALAATGRVGVAFAYAITASNSPTSYVATGLPAGLSVNSTTGAISGTPTIAGTYNATLRAANAAGVGADSTLVITLAAATTAPSITSPATASGQVGTAFSYQAAAAPGTIASYAISPLLPATTGLTFNSVTGAITGSPTQVFTATFTLTATSEGGTSLPQPLTITINPAAGMPVITSAGSATGTVGAAFSYTITATNAPHTSLDAVNLPSGLGVNPYTGVISGVPVSTGTTLASLVATNAAGTGPTRDLAITVQPPAAAPAVNSPEAASAQVGGSFSYQITATNTPTAFEVLGAPPWMTVNSATGALAGTPTTPGFLSVQLVASNSAGISNPRALALMVAAAEGTPRIGSSHNASGSVGAAFTYPITASPAATSFTVTGLPAGLAVNATTGVISGTPTASGTFNVILAGTNASGIGFPLTLVLTITPSATLVVP